ncbi:MAG: T9SS type A sorting domain-containing protein [Candidatus Eiseniibacteriota bacterium]
MKIRTTPASLALVLGLVVTASLPRCISVARAQSTEVMQKITIPQKRTELQMMWDAARLEMAEARREAREARLERAAHGKHRAKSAKPAGERVEGQVFDEDVAAGRLMRGLHAGTLSSNRVTGTQSLPANVLMNDKTPDALGAGQAEQNSVIVGNYGMAAWNDGQGFNSGNDVQSVSYTVDGGLSWQRTPAVAPATAGEPPHLPSAPVNMWSSDPVVTVNEKTNEFWYCGLIDRSATVNGVATVKGTFSGSTFTWGSPLVIKTYTNSTALADKEWMAADSLNGNLYAVWTKFDALGDHIMFSRSINGGTIWSAELEISSAADIGLVQGSRVAVGPAGEVYVVYWAIGATTNEDFMKIRKSTNAGVSFGAEVTLTSEYSNFGTGAPGFNRPSGIQFPTIGVDRSTGAHRGRVYVGFVDCMNWYDDLTGFSGDVGEVEGNGFFAAANPFVSGNVLHGNLTSLTDLDYFSFSATQGQSYFFWCDSLAGTLAYTMRVFCADTSTRLAYSGALTSGPGRNGYIVWTAPAAGTYYLRMAPGSTSAASGTGGYRVLTGRVFASPPPDRARDQRDAFVTFSDNGVSWSTPVRVNDDAGLYDNWLPEVGVGRDGNPYVLWYDWRDAPSNCGGVSNEYLTRSTDGGATWEASRPITTAQTNWTSTASNIAPNQGDYQGVYAGAVISMAWGDGRLGDADVWGTKITVGPQISCANDTTIAAGSVFMPWYNLIDPNILFDDTYQYSLTFDRAWPGTPVAGSQLVLRGSAVGLAPSITVPDTAAVGDVHACLTVSQNGAALTSCCATLHVTAGVTGVGGMPRAEFALHGARPNPSAGHLSVAFSLPDGSPAELELVDIAGRRVYQRDVGALGAGLHVVPIEHAGLPAGVYAVRLTQHGRTLTSKVSVVH